MRVRRRLCPELVDRAEHDMVLWWRQLGALLPSSLRPRHPIDHIPAEGSAGQLVVKGILWLQLGPPWSLRRRICGELPPRAVATEVAGRCELNELPALPKALVPFLLPGSRGTSHDLVDVAAANVPIDDARCIVIDLPADAQPMAFRLLACPHFDAVVAETPVLIVDLVVILVREDIPGMARKEGGLLLVEAGAHRPPPVVIVL
mmetsp:Transcript_120180/g.256468  ORF Transcript_120180/g.256468 Transcript_120180/m.256468 type:complete len:204 (+) Transcript_120180:521-1132(+)